MEDLNFQVLEDAVAIKLDGLSHQINENVLR